MSTDRSHFDLLHHDRDVKGSPLTHVRSCQRLGLLAGRRIVSVILLLASYLVCVFPRSLKPASNKKPHELHSTAYLDALRGYAAFVVYNSHVIHEKWRPESSFIMKFPFAKLWFRGHAMVDVFFVISGYALSYRMLSFIHAKQHARVLDSLASSTFRRYFRLFAPTAVATFVSMLAISTGLAVKGEDPSVSQSTLLGDLQFWIADTVRTSNPFRHVAGWWYGDVFGTQYLPQMWTIPVEFRGSMILFIFLAAVCKMTTRVRLYTTGACIVMFFWWETQYAGEFLVGMLIADLRLWKARQQQSSSASHLMQLPASIPLTSALTGDGTLTEKKPWILTTSPAQTLVSLATSTTFAQQLPWIILFVCSFTPLTAPLLIGTGSEFPFNLIATLMPPKIDQGAQIHFPLAVGAVMMVFALDNSPLLQKPFLLPVSQFIGELSFGIYAMHNTVRWIVWERLFVKWQEAYWGPDAHGFWHLLPGYIAMTILVIWAAEFFRRIDMRIVAWGKVMQDLCFEKD